MRPTASQLAERLEAARETLRQYMLLDPSSQVALAEEVSKVRDNAVEAESCLHHAQSIMEITKDA